MFSGHFFGANSSYRQKSFDTSHNAACGMNVTKHAHAPTLSKRALTNRAADAMQGTSHARASTTSSPRKLIKGVQGARNSQIKTPLFIHFDKESLDGCLYETFTTSSLSIVFFFIHLCNIQSVTRSLHHCRHCHMQLVSLQWDSASSPISIQKDRFLVVADSSWLLTEPCF